MAKDTHQGSRGGGGEKEEFDEQQHMYQLLARLDETSALDEGTILQYVEDALASREWICIEENAGTPTAGGSEGENVHQQTAVSLAQKPTKEVGSTTPARKEDKKEDDKEEEENLPEPQQEQAASPTTTTSATLSRRRCYINVQTKEVLRTAESLCRWYLGEQLALQALHDGTWVQEEEVQPRQTISATTGTPTGMTYRCVSSGEVIFQRRELQQRLLAARTVSTHRKVYWTTMEMLKSRRMSQYILALVRFCRDPAQPYSIRLKGIDLLVSACVVHPYTHNIPEAVQQREQFALRWRECTQGSRLDVKEELLATLATTEPVVREMATLLIATIASVELPQDQWPELLRVLFEAAALEGTDGRESSLAALTVLSAITASMRHTPPLGRSFILFGDCILETVCRAMARLEPAIQYQAMCVLYYALPCLQGHIDDQSQRDYVLAVVCAAAGNTHGDPLVRERSMACLSRIIQLYYSESYLARYKTDLIHLTLKVLAHTVETSPIPRVTHISGGAPEERRRGVPQQQQVQQQGNTERGGNDPTAMRSRTQQPNEFLNDGVVVQVLHLWSTLCKTEAPSPSSGSSGTNQGSSLVGFCQAAFHKLSPLLCQCLLIRRRNARSGTGTRRGEEDEDDKEEYAAASFSSLLNYSLRIAIPSICSEFLPSSSSPASASASRPIQQSDAEEAAAKAATGAYGRSSSSSAGIFDVPIASAASTTLLLLCRAIGEPVVSLVTPFITNFIERPSSLEKEAACTALGCLLHAPHSKTLASHVNLVTSHGGLLALLSPAFLQQQQTSSTSSTAAAAMDIPANDLTTTMGAVDAAGWCVALLCDRYPEVFFSSEESTKKFFEAIEWLFQRGSSPSASSAATVPHQQATMGYGGGSSDDRKLLLRAIQIVHNLALQFEDNDPDTTVNHRPSPILSAFYTHYDGFLDQLLAATRIEGGQLRLEAQEALNALLSVPLPTNNDGGGGFIANDLWKSLDEIQTELFYELEGQVKYLALARTDNSGHQQQPPSAVGTIPREGEEETEEEHLPPHEGEQGVREPVMEIDTNDVGINGGTTWVEYVAALCNGLSRLANRLGQGKRQAPVSGSGGNGAVAAIAHSHSHHKQQQGDGDASTALSFIMRHPAQVIELVSQLLQVVGLHRHPLVAMEALQWLGALVLCFGQDFVRGTSLAEGAASSAGERVSGSDADSSGSIFTGTNTPPPPQFGGATAAAPAHHLGLPSPLGILPQQVTALVDLLCTLLEQLRKSFLPAAGHQPSSSQQSQQRTAAIQCGIAAISCIVDWSAALKEKLALSSDPVILDPLLEHFAEILRIPSSTPPPQQAAPSPSAFSLLSVQCAIVGAIGEMVLNVGFQRFELRRVLFVLGDVLTACNSKEKEHLASTKKSALGQVVQLVLGRQSASGSPPGEGGTSGGTGSSAYHQYFQQQRQQLEREHFTAVVDMCEALCHCLSNLIQSAKGSMMSLAPYASSLIGFPVAVLRNLSKLYSPAGATATADSSSAVVGSLLEEAHRAAASCLGILVFTVGQESARTRKHWASLLLQGPPEVKDALSTASRSSNSGVKQAAKFALSEIHFLGAVSG